MMFKNHFLTCCKCVLGLFLTATGCESAVETRLSESAANEVIVALQEGEIGARKEAAGDGLFNVLVPDSDIGLALGRLRNTGLPRVPHEGFEEIFGEGGLVPTATEERARYVAALGGELAGSIETMDGVLEARVHIALPDGRRFSLDDAPPRARASVLVRHRDTQAPPDENAIRALVVGATTNLASEDVAVVLSAASAPPETIGSLAHIGPFSVARGSATPLKWSFAGLLIVNVFLAVGMVALMVRRRRSFPMAEGE